MTSTRSRRSSHETIEDLHSIADFLKELQKFKPEHDDKLKALIKLLKSDSGSQKAQGPDFHRVHGDGAILEATACESRPYRDR